jgi:hypothetical protein
LHSRSVGSHSLLRCSIVRHEPIPEHYYGHKGRKYNCGPAPVLHPVTAFAICCCLKLVTDSSRCLCALVNFSLGVLCPANFGVGGHESRVECQDVKPEPLRFFPDADEHPSIPASVHLYLFTFV